MTGPIENFDDFVLDAFEPEDYPGDDANEVVEVDWLDDAGQVVGARPEFRPARERWEIRDEGSADWALRRIRRAEMEIDKARTLAESQIRQIERYVDEIEKREERDVDFFGEKLRRYYVDHVFPTMPKRGPFVKRLPSGRLKSRQGSVSTVVDDADALRKFLAKRGLEDAGLKPAVEREPDKAKLKAAFGDRISDEAGEFAAVVETPTGGKPVVVPGVKFVRAPRGFDYEFEDGAE